MGLGAKKRRMAASVVALAIFLAFSSFLGNYILAKEASAGGMDVEWRVPLENGFKQMLVTSDGSLIVKGDQGPIQEIDRSGTVLWTFNASQPDNMIIGAGDLVYFIERGYDDDIINCLYSNGTLFWSLVSDVPVGEMRLGQNGNVYLVELRDQYACLICMTGDGFFKWEFAPEGGLSQFLVLNDGTVMARNMLSVWNGTYNIWGGYVKTVDNLTAISNDGSILWKIDILVEMNPDEYLNGPFLGPNSTIDLYLVHSNGTRDIIEIDRNGNIGKIWVGAQHTRNSYITGDTIYVTENWIDQSSNASSLMLSRITAWNASTGCLNWQSEPDGWVYILDSVNGRDPIFQVGEELVSYGPTGKVIWNATVNLVNRAIIDFDENGLVLSDGRGMLSRMDDHGSTMWGFRLDTRVVSGSLGEDGRIIVMTHDYAISIHKAVLSTTMNYFVVLLAIDLGVTLMYAVWIIDLTWPKAKARTD
jgi:hypothetical protein